MDRTEEDIVRQKSPIKAILCGKEVVIPLLKLQQSLDWHEKWYEVVYIAMDWKESVTRVARLQKEKASEDDLKDALISAYKTILLAQPKKLIDLVCSYVEASDCGITTKDIFANANEAEILILWNQINEIAGSGRPLVTGLADVKIEKK